MFKNIAEVVVGDVIVEGRNLTTVTAVDAEICKHKVHINGKDCYEAFADVQVQGNAKGRRTVQEQYDGDLDL